jgi:hypothetical protein
MSAKEECLGGGFSVEAVGGDVAFECLGEGDTALAAAAFGGDGAVDTVPSAVDVDDAVVEVDVVPAECL